MSDNNHDLALLPNGFVDLLPPFAEIEARSISRLMKKFASFGYQRIKPPLLEFEESMLAPGPGSVLSKETFRVMDPVSHRMLGLRPDSTPQVVRIASSRLVNEPRPLRLTYANDVLRTKGNQLRTVRQFCQVGCEMVGDNTLESKIEICVLAILGLKVLDLGSLTLDMTIPGFVKSIICTDMDAKEKNILEKAVRQRDRGILESLASKEAATLKHVMDVSNDCLDAKQFLSNIDINRFSDDTIRDIKLLQELCIGVEKALSELEIDDVSFSVDPLEQSGFEYHKHMGFTIFSPDIHGELGRGGCYEVSFAQGNKAGGNTSNANRNNNSNNNKEQEIANGFTLYMDTILKACDHIKDRKFIFVSVQESWAVVADLQRQGWTVIRGFPELFPTDSPCTHKYEGGNILPLSLVGDCDL